MNLFLNLFNYCFFIINHFSLLFSISTVMLKRKQLFNEIKYFGIQQFLLRQMVNL